MNHVWSAPLFGRSTCFFLNYCILTWRNIIFCHVLYTKQYKRLIFKRKAHQLLIAGNKIVTKKRRKSLCGRLHAQR